MKKILFTVENYYPEMSGVPVVVKYLAEGLAQMNNYEVHVATRHPQGTKRLETYNSVIIHRFDINFNSFKLCVGDLDGYISFVKKGEFDSIICECTQCVTTDALYPYLNEISANKILHSHGFSGLSLRPYRIMGTFRNTIGNTLNYYRWRKYYQDIFPKYISKFDSVICLSVVDSDYKYLLKYDIPIYIIPNAVEAIFLGGINENKLQLYIDRPPFQYAVCVAYYNDVKNQIGILKEFYKSEACKNMGLVFIGTERNKYYIKLEKKKKQLEKKHGKREVHLLVGVLREHIPGIVKNAMMYLSGSKREAFSISLIESMAVGTPFIGTNVGNTRLLPGGCVIEKMDEMHFMIDKLYYNKKYRRKLSKEGKMYSMENCTIQQAVKNISNIIEEI